MSELLSEITPSTLEKRPAVVYHPTMKRVKFGFYASIHDIDFIAEEYYDAPEGDVDVAFPEGVLDAWDDQGRLVRFVMLPWSFL